MLRTIYAFIFYSFLVLGANAQLVLPGGGSGGGGYDFNAVVPQFWNTFLIQVAGANGCIVCDVVIDHWQYSQDTGTDGYSFVANSANQTDLSNSCQIDHSYVHASRGTY